MKILLISPKMENPNGGIATWTNMFLSNAKNHNIDCEVVNTALVGSRAANGSAKRNFKDEIVRTRRIFSELSMQLSNNTFDAFHINTSCGTLGIIRDYLVAKKIRKSQPSKKIIVHYHCDIQYQLNSKIGRLYLKKILNISNINIVLCENSKTFLEKEFGISSIIIPNPIDPSYTVCSKHINPDLHKLLFVGRVEREKGIPEIYQLAQSLLDLEFVLVGTVSEEISKINKPANIHLVGAVSHDNVKAMMDDADAFIFPTHSEGFSIALLESMSRGLPAVVTDVGANKDMVADGCGIVVNRGDVEGMKAAIDAMRSPDIRQEFSENSLKKVLKCYTTNVIMEQYAECYKS